MRNLAVIDETLDVPTKAYVDSLVGGGGPPTGAAGGDLTGTYPNPTLAVDRVRKSGDTMSGDLVISKTDPWQTLDMAGASNAAWVIKRAGTYRWLWQTQDAETGGNTGSNLVLKPRNDDGSNIAAGMALTITRATGLITVIGNPTAPLGVATKQYVDSKAGGGTTRSVSVISTSTTLAAAASTDYVYVCSAALTATMPTAVGNKNLYTIKRSGTGTVTIATTASQTIDGATTFVLGTQWMAVDLVSDGTNWVVV